MKKLLPLLLLPTALLFASNGAALYHQCAPCHGVKAETSLENKFEAISNWDAKKIEKALIGYKNGTRKDKGMGALMRGKVANLSDSDIKTLSEYIANIN